MKRGYDILDVILQQFNGIDIANCSDTKFGFWWNKEKIKSKLQPKHWYVDQYNI